MIPALGLELAERGLVGDALVRYVVRRWLRSRLDRPDRAHATSSLVAMMRAGPIAPPASPPSQRQDDLPVSFYEQALGPHLMTSCGYWPDGIATLADAEAAMLALTCERAGLADGQRVLELGCGWGSLSLWIARRYPASRVVAVCRSPAERAFIEARRLPNVEVATAEIAEFATGRRFDRVVTVETLERLWNWERLLGRIAAWLEPDGKSFVHLACHSRHASPSDADTLPPLLAGRCFTGIVPSADLIDHFSRDLSVEERWILGGDHYARTAEAWRVQLEARREWVLPILVGRYGRQAAARWYHRWRLFFLGRAELFGYRGGSEWGIAHYRLGRP